MWKQLFAAVGISYLAGYFSRELYQYFSKPSKELVPAEKKNPERDLESKLDKEENPVLKRINEIFKDPTKAIINILDLIDRRHKDQLNAAEKGLTDLIDHFEKIEFDYENTALKEINPTSDSSKKVPEFLKQGKKNHELANAYKAVKQLCEQHQIPTDEKKFYEYILESVKNKTRVSKLKEILEAHTEIKEIFQDTDEKSFEKITELFENANKNTEQLKKVSTAYQDIEKIFKDEGLEIDKAKDILTESKNNKKEIDRLSDLENQYNLAKKIFSDENYKIEKAHEVFKELKDNKDELAKLKKTYQDLITAKEAVDKENAKYKDQIKQLESDLQKNKNEINEICKSLHVTRSEDIRAVSVKISETEKELIGKTYELKVLELEKSKSTEQYKTLTSEYQQLKIEVASLQQQEKKLREDWVANKAQQLKLENTYLNEKKKLNIVSKELELLKNKEMTLKTTKEQDDLKIANLEKEKNKLIEAQQISQKKLEDQISKLKFEVSEYPAKIQKLLSEQSSVELTKRAKLVEEIQDLTQKLNESQNALLKLQAEINEIHDELSKTEFKNVKELGEALKKLEKDFSEDKKKLAELNQKISETSSNQTLDLYEKSKEIERLTTEAQQGKEKHEKIVNELNAVNTKMNQLNDQYKRLTEEKERLEKLADENKELKTTIASLKESESSSKEVIKYLQKGGLSLSQGTLNLQTQHQKSQDQIKILEKDINSYKTKIQEHELANQQLKNDIEKLRAQLTVNNNAQPTVVIQTPVKMTGQITANNNSQPVVVALSPVKITGQIASNPRYLEEFILLLTRADETIRKSIFQDAENARSLNHAFYQKMCVLVKMSEMSDDLLKELPPINKNIETDVYKRVLVGLELTSLPKKIFKIEAQKDYENKLEKVQKNESKMTERLKNNANFDEILQNPKTAGIVSNVLMTAFFEYKDDSTPSYYAENMSYIHLLNSFKALSVMQQKSLCERILTNNSVRQEKGKVNPENAMGRARLALQDNHFELAVKLFSNMNELLSLACKVIDTDGYAVKLFQCKMGIQLCILTSIAKHIHQGATLNMTNECKALLCEIFYDTSVHIEVFKYYISADFISSKGIFTLLMSMIREKMNSNDVDTHFIAKLKKISDISYCQSDLPDIQKFQMRYHQKEILKACLAYEYKFVNDKSHWISQKFYTAGNRDLLFLHETINPDDFFATKDERIIFYYLSRPELTHLWTEKFSKNLNKFIETLLNEERYPARDILLACFYGYKSLRAIINPDFVPKIVKVLHEIPQSVVQVNLDLPPPTPPRPVKVDVAPSLPPRNVESRALPALPPTTPNTSPRVAFLSGISQGQAQLKKTEISNESKETVKTPSNVTDVLLDRINNISQDILDAMHKRRPQIVVEDEDNSEDWEEEEQLSVSSKK